MLYLQHDIFFLFKKQTEGISKPVNKLGLQYKVMDVQKKKSWMFHLTTSGISMQKN